MKKKVCSQCERSKRSHGSMSSISNSDSGVDYKGYKTNKANESSPLLIANNPNCRLHNGSVSPLPVYESNGRTYPELMKRSATGSDSDIDYSRIRLEQTNHGKFTEISPPRSDSGADSASGSSNNTESMNMKLNLQALDGQNDTDSDWTDNMFFKIILFPFRVCFWITLPRPSQYTFVLTFLSSVIWIALLSYVIVWMVTILCKFLESFSHLQI